MKKAVQLQGEKKGLDYYVAIKTKDAIYSGVNVCKDANVIVIKNFNDELVTVNKVDVIEFVTVNNMKALDYQLMGMQEEQQTKEPTGYYFLSVRSVYKDMPCTVHIHNKKNILSKEEFEKIYADAPKDNSYGETISFDIFRADEIPKVLKDIELDEPLIIKPLLKNQYKSDNYASISAMDYDLRPKHGGMISKNIKGYLLSFCFDEAEEIISPIPF